MALNNQTQSFNTTSSPSPSVSSLIITLGLLQQRFISQLPLIMTILGFIGFIGNTFTFLQPALRKNSFCIYTLCGSVVDIISLFVNLFPSYINFATGNLFTMLSVSLICKLTLFAALFLPQLSMNLLILSLIDRYACTYGPTSSMRHLLKLKMVPVLIGITVIFSCLISLYAPILYDVIPGFGCITTAPTVNAAFYVTIHGIITPIVMLVLMLLTYRRSKLSRQRVGAVVVANIHRLRNQFIAMVFAQAFVTSFFALQWIIVYCYFLATRYDNKSAEGWAITYFLFSLTNNLYYFINVRSFYLSTLTSRRFRDTFITGVLKLLPGNFYRRWNARNQNVLITAVAGTRRTEVPPRQI